MLKDLKPYFNAERTCMENLFISLIQKYGNVEKLYLYAWNFGYLNKKNINFGERIMPSREGEGLNKEIEKALQEFFGIRVIWHLNYAKNAIKVIKDELERGRPVIIGIDIFECEWHKVFQKYHSVHYCLVIGVTNEELVCIDDTLASCNGNLRLVHRPEYITIPFQKYLQYGFGLVTLEISDNRRNPENSLYKSALKTLTGFRGVTDFDQMRQLRADIVTEFDIKKEINGFEDAWALDIVRALGYIVWNRKNFLTAQKIFSRETENIYMYCKKMESIIIKWENIKNYILKYALENSKNAFDINYIATTLDKKIYEEESLAISIVDEYEAKND